MSKRFYQIAFDLGVQPRHFIRELNGAGLSVGNQMVVITPELEDRIREVHQELFEPTPPAPVVEEAPMPVETEAAVATEEIAQDGAATEGASVDTVPPEGEPEGQVPSEVQLPEMPVETPAPAEPAVAAAAGTGSEAAVVDGGEAAVSPGLDMAAEATAAPTAGTGDVDTPSVDIKESGSQKTGIQETGIQETGIQGTGIQGTGPQGTGPQETGPQGTGSQDAGTTPEAGSVGAAEAAAPAATGQADVGTPTDATKPTAAEAAPGAGDGRRRRAGAGHAPTGGDLVPTIDPRAGRLVKDAPRGGIPGVTAPPRGRAGAPAAPEIQNLNPTIPTSDRAPGARRDSHRRSTIPERFRGKRGKETFHMRRRSRKSKREPARPRPTAFPVEPPCSVKKFSELSGLKAAEIVKALFAKHQMIVNMNSNLDQDTLEILALEFELDLTFTARKTAEDDLISRVQSEDDPDDLQARPPVVTILGHVDHGKTTLLDKIRASDVAAHEAGGITQHISASQVHLPDGRKVTFIDTPGHEAFTEMRARGAQVTDVVILIVAADDGVMPQTVESISHVRAADVPMVVAITKSDRNNANPQRVRQQLTEHGVFVEGYGGDVSAFDCSGITGQGVPEILEHLVLMAEVEEERFRANPTRMAEGTVIESENSPQRGVVATVLVQNGTLKRGDAVLAGETFGSVRAMFDYRGKPVDAALPGDPVEIIGLDQPPGAGSKFYVLEDTNKARAIADTRRLKHREEELAAQSKPTTIESLFGAISEGKIQELNVVLKADVKGSLEPIKGLLSRMGTEEVRVKVIHSAVGAVNDSDVILAGASQAWVIGFNVNIDDRARDRAKSTAVEIRTYRVIYDIEKDVRDALEGKLTPDLNEVIQGHAEILQVFQSSRLGNIAGCRVRDGVIQRDSMIRVRRGGEVIKETKIASLRREKDEVREVKDGFECGIRLDGWDGYKQGDELEAYTFEEVRRTLD